MIEVIPELMEVNGHKKIKVTVRDGDRVIDADTVNPLNSRERKKVARRLGESTGDMRQIELIERVLLNSVDLLDEAGDGKNGDEPQAEVVADGLKLVRAELVVSEEVVALSVPETVLVGSEARGRWKMYASWKDGKREAMALPGRLGGALWIHPTPGDPAVPVTSLWSSLSRQNWLAGKGDVSTRKVFETLYRAFEDYLEVGEGSAVRVQGSGNTGGANTDSSPSSLNPEPQTLNPVTSTLALWTLLTYCYPAWDAVPYLYIGGPAGSGKTRVFELLSRLAYRPIVSSNLSAAALFRTLHERGGTLLLDEAERLNDSSPEIAEVKSILLAGYKRGGRATRLEASGDSYRMSEFQVFGPKAIACINPPPGPLLSRCIAIQMFRADPECAKGKKLIDENPQRWQDLRDDLHCLALGELGINACELARQRDVCTFAGRNHELWQPIMALAESIDATGALAGRIGNWAVEVIDGTSEESLSEAEVIVMRALVWKLRQGLEPTCTQILNSAKMIHEPTFRNVSPRGIGAMLKKFGVRSEHLQRGSIFRSTAMNVLKRIERNHGVDLNTQDTNDATVASGPY